MLQGRLVMDGDIDIDIDIDIDMGLFFHTKIISNCGLIRFERPAQINIKY